MLTTLTGTTADDSATDQAPPGLTVIYSAGLARAGQQVRFSAGAPLVVGRGDVSLGQPPLADPKMSRDHARFERRDGHYLVIDGGSRNGTFVNGQRLVSPHRLAPGEVVQLGHTLLVFGEIPGRCLEPDEPSLAGVGAAIRSVREALSLIAPTDHAVLLLGETGTGKELAAREVHRQSGRSGPFVAVNCASLTGDLLESQLFGYVKGAFTGANRAHEGLFRRADGGTLFLDEIGEMPDGLQARLLRVLQERSVRPVGGTAEIKVATRVVAATNQDVAAAVRAGAFRADLYARLTEWTVTLPPLRRRREDLGVLVGALLRRSGDARRELDVDFKLMRALVTHRWPLNVRGLSNVLTTARVAQPGVDRLTMVPRVQEALAAQAAIAPDSPSSESAPQGAPSQERVTRLLEVHGGNVAAVGRELGLARQQIYRMLRRWDLDPASFRAP